MISVTEAKKIIDNNTVLLTPKELALKDAAGLVLAEDIYASMDIPAYPQSAMDGYAFLFADWEKEKKLQIQGEIAAGESTQKPVIPNTAIRIFTGAPVPIGIDTVVMQEKVSVINNNLIISDDKLKAGDNVRGKGSEVKAGSLAVEKGMILQPATIGFLAGIGVNSVKVFRKPTIAIVVTGNELQQPGQRLVYGQVYESNAHSLNAALQQLHCNDITIAYAMDILDDVKNKLKEALATSDIILLTGGVSVGDYDFVLQAADECGVTKSFHIVKQKPGKPLYFGTKQNKLVFGLPGNPSSVLSCFYQYVLPAISKMIQKDCSMQTRTAILTKPYKKNAGLTYFLKGYYNGHTVTPLQAQESYRMQSFAVANCLIELNENETFIEENTEVTIYLIPQY